jgi:hypothetical protein
VIAELARVALRGAQLGRGAEVVTGRAGRPADLVVAELALVAVVALVAELAAVVSSSAAVTMRWGRRWRAWWSPSSSCPRWWRWR